MCLLYRKKRDSFSGGDRIGRKWGAGMEVWRWGAPRTQRAGFIGE